MAHITRESKSNAYAQVINMSGVINVVQVNGAPDPDLPMPAASDNRDAWEAIADDWEKNQTAAGDDGNDMFTQCLLPQVQELSNWSKGKSVLDLGAGSGILCRMFAKLGAKQVVGLDYSRAMIKIAKDRCEKDGQSIDYDFIDLMDVDMMTKYASGLSEKFDIITISTTLKSLPDLEPIAKALPLLLKPNGCIVNVDLHPAFSKPAGHRGIEIYEDPRTGKQQIDTYIKVKQYLHIQPSQSEAVRGQPKPLTVYHRPFWSLLEPFFRNGLVLDAMREPAFETKGGDPAHPHSYHNFPQTPMLLAFRLKHAAVRE